MAKMPAETHWMVVSDMQFLDVARQRGGPTIALPETSGSTFHPAPILQALARPCARPGGKKKPRRVAGPMR